MLLRIILFKNKNKYKIRNLMVYLIFRLYGEGMCIYNWESDRDEETEKF